MNHRQTRFFLARLFLRYTHASTWRAILTDKNKRRKRLASQIFSHGLFFTPLGC